MEKDIKDTSFEQIEKGIKGWIAEDTVAHHILGLERQRLSYIKNLEAVLNALSIIETNHPNDEQKIYTYKKEIYEIIYKFSSN